MAGFEFEKVSDAGDLVRGQCSLVIDETGAPRVAYTTRTGEVVVARRESGTWVDEKPGGPIVAAGTEDRVWLQIDSAGNPHIAYIEESIRRLIYGVRGSDQRWDFTPVPTHLPPHEPMVFSLCFALHPGGQNPELRDTPHMSFEDQSSNSLGYARKLGEVWKVSRAALPRQFDDITSSRTGQSTSLSFSESQSLQIAYVETFELNPTTLIHTKRVLGITDDQFGSERDVEQGQFFVGRTSILSSGSQTWVAYCEVTNRVLKAGTFDRDGGSVVEVVAAVVSRTVPVLAENPTVDGELADRLRIAYADDGKVKLARRERLGGWTAEVIDPDGGEMPFLAYDNLGNVHMAYATGRALKYAKGQPE